MGPSLLCGGYGGFVGISMRGVVSCVGNAARRHSFYYAGCLECGTCRIARVGTIIGTWVNSGLTMGVLYRLE